MDNEQSSSMNNNPQNPQTPVQPLAAEPNPLQGGSAVSLAPLVIPTTDSQPAAASSLVSSEGVQTVPPVVSPQNPVPPVLGPVSSPTAGNMPPEGEKSNNMMFVLAVLGVLLAVTIFGVIYWYTSSQKQLDTENESEVARTQNIQEVSNLNQELDSLETLNVDSELVDVDRDLQSL